MSKNFKTSASSSRAAPAGGFGGFGGFGTSASASKLSYLAEMPNLSSISDPNLVIAFKGLRKSDTTTKLRSISTISAYAKEHENGGVEDAVMDAWVHFYPRLSIANDRRVREASHSLQAALLKAAGKRMLKYIPRIIGVWLAGCYDKDTLVSRAAQAGIDQFLDTEEKVHQFWKRGQAQILEYAREAMRETPTTLSDERNTALDDRTEVFHRVQCSSLSLVTNLLLKLTSEDIQSCQSQYEEFFSDDKNIWYCGSSPDASIRKAACNLLVACLDKQPAIIDANLERVGTGYIALSLRKSQSTTALLLLQALETLTARYPTVWDGPYRVSKDKAPSSFDILRRFVKHGSQGCSSKYWLSLRSIVQTLPAKILPSNTESGLDFLTSLKSGIDAEPKQNLEQAWSSYFSIARIIISNIAEMKDRDEVVKQGVIQVIDQYLAGESSAPTSALAEAYYVLVPSTDIGRSEKCLLDHLSAFANSLAQQVRQSVEVVHKSVEQHTQSQRQVIQLAHRWFVLLADILKMKGARDYADRILVPSRTVFIAAIETITAEDGKAYSAAAIVEMVLRLAPVLLDQQTQDPMKSLVETHIPRLIMSPSSRHLVSLLAVLSSFPTQAISFERGWDATIDHLVGFSPRNDTFNVLKGMVDYSPATKLAKTKPGLQALFLDAHTESLKGQADAWALMRTAISFDCVAEPGLTALIVDVLRRLDPKDVSSEQFEVALKTLEFIAHEQPKALHERSTQYAELMTVLMRLCETSDDAVVSRALKLMSAVEKGNTDAQSTGQSPMLKLIQDNLQIESSNGLLLVETLISQAVSVKDTNGTSFPAVDFFPNVARWSELLKEPLSYPPDPALGVMRPMGGPALLATRTSVDAQAIDLPSFQPLVRMALFTSRLVDDMDLVSRLPKDVLVELLHNLVLTVEIVSDTIDIHPNGEIPEVVIDFEATNDLLSSNSLFKGIIEAHSWHAGQPLEAKDDMSSIVNSLCAKLIQTAGSTVGAYYAAKAINHLLARVSDANDCTIADCEKYLTDTGVVRLAAKDTFSNVGIISGFGTNLSNSKVANNLCNKLVSTIADAKPQSENTLESLVLLNAALAVYDEEEDGIPVSTNRLVFAVKQILSWSETLPGSDTRLASEACHALQRLLPAIKEVYGTYWETTLEFCINIWHFSKDGKLADDIIPMVGMSLKLYSILRKIQDPNDDLQEAFANYNQRIAEGIIHLLKLERPIHRKPLEFVDELLLREVREISPDQLEDQSDLYLVLSSDIKKVQSAAFHLLHSAIPKAQQQLSVDVVLEKKDARLPDELLSLLLNSPTLESYSEEELETFPAPIRCYLLSWYLVYYSFSAASAKVQNDYTEILKSEQFVSPLLEFLFGVLGHSSGRPIDLNRRGFTGTAWGYDLWDPSIELDPERDMEWLLINLWFMCLKYTPDLAKTWYLAVKSKQTSLAIASWTEKYFSPHLITEAKDVATKWAAEQETSGDEKELLVRVSKNSPSINVGYEIDELEMSIAMILPSAYPLERVEVKGVNRVAVKESTWNGWMRTIQGATMFNNGTVADGLSVFKKNIVAALKGQTECSICYSIISSDKRMPDKRCQTCKNLFHANCLFKWFASSNASTCPMCRQPFNYAASLAQRPRGEA